MKKIGRPTKMTRDIVAKITEALSFGLSDEEAADVAGIDEVTMVRWRKQPAFRQDIKHAVAARLLLRLKRIDAGLIGWQGTAWCLERMYPTRFAKPEIQLSFHSNYTQNNLSISVTVSEAKEIEAIAEPVRQSVKDMFATYKPQQLGNRNGE